VKENPLNLWLPLRSLLRNRRRSALSVTIIALGTAVSFFFLGYIQESRALIQETTVQEFGNVQIASSDLWDDTSEGYDYLLSTGQVEAVEGILSAEPSVVGSTPQLQFPGLVAAGDQSQVVRVTALVPGNDTLSYGDHVVAGRDLTGEDTAAVLVGRALADRLDLAPGSVITLTLTTVTGAYNATPLRVAGIFRFTSEQFELQTLFVPLPYAQLVFSTMGVDRLIVSLDDIAATNPVRDRLQDAFDAGGLGLEVKTWDELSPFYRELSGLFNILFGFVALATAVLVFFIILQVLTLAFLERTREVGTIRALGTTRGGVFRLLLSESAWLAVLGSLAGVAVGVCFAVAFNAIGIEWTPPGTLDPVMLTVRVTPTTAIGPFSVGLIATLLSAVFPAVQMSRLQVVDALRME
jgi:putative ABC transport system permease protein